MLEEKRGDDLELVRRVRSGDLDALEVLYHRYAPIVHGVALRILRCPEEARDELQRVFAALPENVGKFSASGSFAGWLRKVAQNSALQRQRRKARETELKPETLEAAAANEDPIESVRLERALAVLPERHRVVFLLKAAEECPHEEIAERLGTSVNYSMVLYHRAKKRLREELLGSE